MSENVPAQIVASVLRTQLCSASLRHDEELTVSEPAQGWSQLSMLRTLEVCLGSDDARVSADDRALLDMLPMSCPGDSLE